MSSSVSSTSSGSAVSSSAFSIKLPPLQVTPHSVSQKAAESTDLFWKVSNTITACKAPQKVFALPTIHRSLQQRKLAPMVYKTREVDAVSASAVSVASSSSVSSSTAVSTSGVTKKHFYALLPYDRTGWYEHEDGIDIIQAEEVYEVPSPRYLRLKIADVPKNRREEWKGVQWVIKHEYFECEGPVRHLTLEEYISWVKSMPLPGMVLTVIDSASQYIKRKKLKDESVSSGSQTAAP